MGLSLNKIVKPQTIQLNKRAVVSSNSLSPAKRLYVDGGEHMMTKRDVLYLLKNIRGIYNLPYTLWKTVSLIKKDKRSFATRITYEDFQKLDKLLKTLGVDDYGFFEITPEKLFQNSGSPHRFALVLSFAMDKVAFQSAPSIECQYDVARIYVNSGDAANRVALLLQEMGYGASPNHSMGGQLDYSMAAQWAGIGVVGRHSMAITARNGACQRISIVYTSIENFDEFIQRDFDEISWVPGFCKKCGKCIRKCPKGAIFNEPVLLDGHNPTKIDYDKCCEGFTSYGCGICIKECPFTTGDYKKMKAATIGRSVK